MFSCGSKRYLWTNQKKIKNGVSGLTINGLIEIIIGAAQGEIIMSCAAPLCVITGMILQFN